MARGEKAQLFQGQLGDPANCKSPMDLETRVRCKEENEEVRSRDISMHRHEGLTLLGAEGPGVQLTAKVKERRQFRSERQSQESFLESVPIGKKVRRMSRVGKPRPQLGDK